MHLGEPHPQEKIKEIVLANNLKVERLLDRRVWVMSFVYF